MENGEKDLSNTVITSNGIIANVSGSGFSAFRSPNFNNKKMKIEFIYTYNEKPQEIVSYPFVLPILQDKETMLKFALSDLSEDERQQLVKISTCIYFENEGEIELPKWFNECNGKLYFENGVEQPF